MSDPVVYRGGDSSLDERLLALLGHKGAPYFDHVQDFFRQQRDGAVEGLEWRFHLLLQEGRPVANICTWEACGAVVLGHVYTLPAHRGRGLASTLLAHIVADARGRNVETIDLNTEPGSAAAALYERHGFRPLPHCPGAMRLVLATPSIDEDPVMPPEEVRWCHMPRLNHFLLDATHAGRRLETLGVLLPSSAERLLLDVRFPAPGAPRVDLRVACTRRGTVDRIWLHSNGVAREELA